MSRNSPVSTKISPPILALRSVVDATVTAPALVAGLFDRLPAGQHQLVLYDINRYTEIEPILTSNPTAWTDNILRGRRHDYTVTLVSKRRQASNAVVALSRRPRSVTDTGGRFDASAVETVLSLSVATSLATVLKRYGATA